MRLRMPNRRRERAEERSEIADSLARLDAAIAASPEARAVAERLGTREQLERRLRRAG